MHTWPEMHYLHPRSRTTGTLFTTTLAVSFLVVALPHLLPCPVDRRQYADTMEMPDGTIRRRRKRTLPQEDDDAERTVAQVEVDSEQLASDRRPPRECPVPKPGGLVGQITGLERRKKEREAPSEVMVQEWRVQWRRGAGETGSGGGEGP